jgi:tetratricopeptide (TPR) repeat protein
MFPHIKKYASGLGFFAAELDRYFLDYVPGTLNQLVITFENADQPKRPRLDGLREPWGLNFLLGKGYSVLGVKPKAADWYRGPDLHAFFRSHDFKIFISSFNKIILYGSSMGGFAALTFAEVCPGACVIAFNPQSTMKPDLVPWEHRFAEARAQDWSGDFADASIGARFAKTVYVAYDPLFDLDYRHVDRLDGANLVHFKMPLVGHVVASWMHEANVLSTFLDGALSGTIEEPRCRQLARQRRNIPRYYAGMGLRTRSMAVARVCLRKLLDFKLNIHHQNDFKSLLINQQLWDFLGEDQVRAILTNFDDGVLVGILKAASDVGFHALVWEICDDVISRRDTGWQILVLTAECLQRLSRLPEAEAMARRGIAKAPAIGNGHRCLARILFDSGEWQAACAAGQEAVSLDPHSFLGWRDLARYHEALGQFAPALRAAERAAALNPNDQAVLRLIDTISKRIAEQAEP